MSKSIQFDFQFCLLSTDNNITIALYFVIFCFVSMPKLDNFEEYIFICEKHGLTEEEEALELSNYLHDLGTFLHFQEDELLKRIIILQNEWATEAVYRLLDDEEIKGNYGRFSLQKAKKTWHEAHYKHKIPELLNLMMKFEMCNKLQETKNHFLIPQLLPNSKPNGLFSLGANSLQLRYRYDFLPKGLISRFIVRTHEYIENHENSWKSGVQLKRDKAIAFIEESYNQNLISIHVSGENQKEFMTIVSEEMDKLNRTYQGIKVEKLVPCNCVSCKQNAEPHFYEYRNLFNRIRKGKKTIECQNDPFDDVDVIGLVDDLYNRDFLRSILAEDWKFPYDYSHKESAENYKKVLSRLYDVKDEVIQSREDILFQSRSIKEKIDSSNKMLLDKLMKKLSAEKTELFNEISTHLAQSSEETQQEIGDLVFETLENIQISHQDISADLNEINSKTHSIKAKIHMGLPYLLSIEAEKDVTEEMTSLKKSLADRYPKVSAIVKWLNSAPKK